MFGVFQSGFPHAHIQQFHTHNFVNDFIEFLHVISHFIICLPGAPFALGPTAPVGVCPATWNVPG